jgi:hypothetical protein
LLIVDSAGYNQPAMPPTGFLTHRAVCDLSIALHWLEIDGVSRTMSPEEVLERQRVHESIQELLLACQLIAIPLLSR